MEMRGLSIAFALGVALIDQASAQEATARTPAAAERTANEGTEARIDDPEAHAHDPEAAAITELARLQAEATHKFKGRRAQHPKAHGFVIGTFAVQGGLPDDVRVGLFASPRSYRCVVRFSNGARDDDRVPDVHGMAVKVVGIEAGDGSAGKSVTQDFVLLDQPVFFARDAASMLDFFKAQAEVGGKVKADPSTDVVAEFKRLLGREHPEELPIFLGYRKQIASPLETTYFSTVPFRLGGGAAKYEAVPRGPAVASAPASQDHLREVMVGRLAAGKDPVVFDFKVRRQVEPEKQPIEDPTKLWESPEVVVATIEFEPQAFDSDSRKAFGENLEFDVWHALPEHEPLGSINRARRKSYPLSSEVRHQLLKEAKREPSTPKEPTKEDLEAQI